MKRYSSRGILLSMYTVYMHMFKCSAYNKNYATFNSVTKYVNSGFHPCINEIFIFLGR
jgi:hypothetical protein